MSCFDIVMTVMCAWRERIDSLTNDTHIPANSAAKSPYFTARDFAFALA